MKYIFSLFDLGFQTDGASITDPYIQQPYKIGPQVQHGIITTGGLSGRLDQTVRTFSYLHTLGELCGSVFAPTNDNAAWVGDSVCPPPPIFRDDFG